MKKVKTNNISTPGDNGGVNEYKSKEKNPNIQNFFSVSDTEMNEMGIPDGMKEIECSDCELLLPWFEYAWCWKGLHNQRQTLNSRRCKRCTAKQSRMVRELKKLTPPPPKGTHCAIDDCEKTDLHCDHDHETGKVRGYICTQHNTGIGKIGDGLMGIVNVLKYLLETSDDEDEIIKVKKELTKLIK